MEPNDVSPINKETAERYVWGSVCGGWHLVKNSELSVIQERMPPGDFEVRHFHHRAQQFFYILSGEAAMEVGGNLVTLRGGEGFWIPAGRVHQMRNNSDIDLHFLVISQPPSHGDREVVDES